MKLHGQPISSDFSAVCLLRRGQHEPLAVTLKPLSLGFHQRLRMRGIIPPQPPTKVARDSTGKPMRDSRGQVLTLQDSQHQDYLAELDEYHRCVGVLAIAESLEGSSEITFETPPPESDGRVEWMDYVRALHAEMERAGFAAGDLPLLCREICRVSNLLDDQLTAVQANFSSSADRSSA